MGLARQGLGPLVVGLPNKSSAVRDCCAWLSRETFQKVGYLMPGQWGGLLKVTTFAPPSRPTLLRVVMMLFRVEYV